MVRARTNSTAISTQVVGEVVNSILRNGAMSEGEIRELIRRFYARCAVVPTTESIQIDASQLRERYSLSHWDSLLVSAALQSRATVMYSEDMQDGIMIEDRLTIVNPFGTR